MNSAAKFLRARDLVDKPKIEEILQHQIKKWRALGWAFVGPPGRLRVAILVERKLEKPKYPIRTIRLPSGGSLKLAVRAVHRDASDTTPSSGGDVMPAGGGVSYLAPGVPIAVAGERIGIGAVLAVNGAPHIITCGHASASAMKTADNQRVIATLVANYYPHLDAAVYRVNPDGLAMFRKGADADSWCDDTQTPSPADNALDATFWPTWKNGAADFIEDVLAYSASCAGEDDYVMLSRCTNQGDSGSSLQLDSKYYGLASRRDGNYSYFTPIQSVIDRLAGALVAPWRP